MGSCHEKDYYIHRHVFCPIQDSSVWLKNLSVEFLAVTKVSFLGLCSKMQIIPIKNLNIKKVVPQFLWFFRLKCWFKGQIISRIHLSLPNYCGDFTRGFDTQNYPKLQASLGTQPENTHRFQRQTQPNPYPWIFSGNTLGYPWVPTLNFYPWVSWVPALIFYPWVPWVPVLSF